MSSVRGLSVLTVKTEKIDTDYKTLFLLAKFFKPFMSSIFVAHQYGGRKIGHKHLELPLELSNPLIISTAAIKNLHIHFSHFLIFLNGEKSLDK